MWFLSHDLGGLPCTSFSLDHSGTLVLFAFPLAKCRGFSDQELAAVAQGTGEIENSPSQGVHRDAVL